MPSVMEASLSSKTRAESSQDLISRVPEYLQLAETVGRKAREAFRHLRVIDCQRRNALLRRLVAILQSEQQRTAVWAANDKDISAAQEQSLSPSLIDRMKLTPQRWEDMIQALYDIAALPDPLGEVVQGKTLPNGVELLQKRVPLGVLFTIYESRPNVTLDVAALCLKSGNCAILRGGREAWHTNRALFSALQTAILELDFPAASAQFIEESDRAFMLALLRQERWIDLVVPRGGENLIRFITQNSHIPVVKHDKGVCNMFIDKSASLEQAASLAINAKLQRPSVCNTIENLVIHKEFSFTKDLLARLQEAGVHLLGCKEAQKYCNSLTLISQEEYDREYSQEYLDARLSVKMVASVDEAVDFIYCYGSGHSEAIVANDSQSIHSFQNQVDTAAIFVNCSTRFHDGGQMGFGAEVGISTGRLHVRGPMSLKDLTTTTFFMHGSGQIRQ